MIIKFLKFVARFFIKSNGFDPRSLINLRFLPKYLKDEKSWIKQGGKIDKRSIILNDFESEAGTTQGEYFHQDLLVAKFIFDRNPKRHIDVGSRIDGFVAHVASYREIEILDIRPLHKIQHQNISFIQADLMNVQDLQKTDSLSCLHAIEHFGLGRYKDPIDIYGHIKGINNLISILEKGGIFYISFPIGKKNEVYFNEQRIFHPKSILEITNIKNLMQLIRFDYVDIYGDLHQNCDLENISYEYISCGIYTFKRIH